MPGPALDNDILDFKVLLSRDDTQEDLGRGESISA